MYKLPQPCPPSCTHLAHAARVALARPCTAADQNFGGECFNCGHAAPLPRMDGRGIVNVPHNEDNR